MYNSFPTEFIDYILRTLQVFFSRFSCYSSFHCVVAKPFPSECALWRKHEKKQHNGAESILLTSWLLCREENDKCQFVNRFVIKAIKCYFFPRCFFWIRFISYHLCDSDGVIFTTTHTPYFCLAWLCINCDKSACSRLCFCIFFTLKWSLKWWFIYFFFPFHPIKIFGCINRYK